MKIAIEIPDEFINEYRKDKFDESLARIITDMDFSSDTDKFTLTGRYELETLKMLKNSFRDSMVIQENYKLLVDVISYDVSHSIPIENVELYKEEEE